MNKNLYVNMKVLHEVLTLMGYCEDQHSRYTRAYMRHSVERHYRLRYFHLIIRARETSRRWQLTLHRDVRVPYPPGHKAVFKGKLVEEEFSKVLSAYKTKMCYTSPKEIVV